MRRRLGLLGERSDAWECIQSSSAVSIGVFLGQKGGQRVRAGMKGCVCGMSGSLCHGDPNGTAAWRRLVYSWGGGIIYSYGV